MKDGSVKVGVVVGGPCPKGGDTTIDGKNVCIIPASVPRPDGGIAGKILQIIGTGAVSDHDGFTRITDARDGSWP